MQSLLYSLTQISIAQIFGIVVISLLSAQVVASISYFFRRFIDRHILIMLALLVSLIALIFDTSVVAVKSHNVQEVLDARSYLVTRDHDTIELKVDSSYFPKTTELKIVSENDSTIQVNYGNKTFSINRSELKKEV